VLLIADPRAFNEPHLGERGQCPVHRVAAHQADHLRAVEGPVGLPIQQAQDPLLDAGEEGVGDAHRSSTVRRARCLDRPRQFFVVPFRSSCGDVDHIPEAAAAIQLQHP
jgi:hypothetical protein